MVTSSLSQPLDPADRPLNAWQHNAAIWSHELQTPVNQLESLLQLIAQEPLSQRQQRWQHLAQVAVGQLNDLVRRFSQGVAQPPTQARSVDPVAAFYLSSGWTPIIHLLTDIGQWYQWRCAKQGLRLYQVVSHRVPTYLPTPPCPIRQIVGNLLNNALEWTTQGDIRLQVDFMDHQLVIQVADTGPGIALAQQATIFQPFQSGHPDKLHGGHRGLGLSIAQQLAQDNNGQLTFQSEPGQGSCFQLVWPVEMPALGRHSPLTTEALGAVCQQLGWQKGAVEDPQQPILIDVRSPKRLAKWLSSLSNVSGQNACLYWSLPAQRTFLIQHLIARHFSVEDQFLVTHPTDILAVEALLQHKKKGTTPVSAPLLTEATRTAWAAGAVPRVIYLTLDDCGCGDEVVSALQQLGMATEVCVYPEIPPDLSSLRQTYGRADWYCLCTNGLTPETVERWLTDPRWQEETQPIIVMDAEHQWDRWITRWNHQRPGSCLTLSRPDEFSKVFAQVALRPWMNQRSLLFVTHQDCDRTDQLQAQVERLGIQFDLAQYQGLLPSADSLLATRDRLPQYLCLCADGLSPAEIQQWFEQTQALLETAPYDPIALLLLDDRSLESPALIPPLTASPWRPSLVLHNPEQLPALLKQTLLNATDATTPQARQRANGLPATSLRILLLEDNPVSRVILTHQLTALGHQVQAVATLAECLAILRTGDILSLPPQLVISDLHLPGRYPVASLVEALQQATALLEIPVVGLFAYASSEEMEQARSAGLSACLSKPVETALWVQLLGQLFPQAGFADSDIKPENVRLMPGPSVSTQQSASSQPSVCWDSLLVMLEGNERLARQVAGIFLEDVPVLIRLLDLLIEQQDWLGVAHEAHQLKGSATYLHAHELRELAYALEKEASQTEVSKVTCRTLLSGIQQEQRRCQQALAPWLKAQPVAPVLV